ncbi:hypothetical protein [Phenylobacterium immobile]|uniref:hypothetical protein n=1 Tax=Phenylobacterium immobile TaxID=21 RepID=UPI000A48E29F|nr:hypothetical protein [Phenylobacterium immobile]
MSSTHLFGAAKAVSYTILFIAAVAVLFRGVVNTLWGSGSELGLLGAVGAAALGVLGLAWFAMVLVKDVAKHFIIEKDETIHD